MNSLFASVTALLLYIATVIDTTANITSSTTATTEPTLMYSMISIVYVP